MSDYADWADPRLGQAYDLLCEVADSLPSDSDIRTRTLSLRDAIEQLDLDLEGGA